jgi:hypothetical protein
MGRSGGHYWPSAEKVSAEVHKLLPKVYNLGERLRLERKLADLRAMLDTLPLSGKPRLRAAAG